MRIPKFQNFPSPSSRHIESLNIIEQQHWSLLLLTFKQYEWFLLQRRHDEDLRWSSQRMQMPWWCFRILCSMVIRCNKRVYYGTTLGKLSQRFWAELRGAFLFLLFACDRFQLPSQCLVPPTAHQNPCGPCDQAALLFIFLLFVFPFPGTWSVHDPNSDGMRETPNQFSKR